MSIFQLVSILFALFMMYLIRIHRRKLLLPRYEVMFWYVLWIGFIFAAIFPNSLLGIVQALHFSRVFDLLLVIAMMILTIIVFATYFNQKQSAKKLEDLVRTEALKK